LIQRKVAFADALLPIGSRNGSSGPYSTRFAALTGR